jgi:putative oxidoreductase
MDLEAALLGSGPERGPRAIAALIARVAGGAVFVVFGIGKFVNRAHEIDSFRDYDLPSPEVFVVVIGVIEIVCGLLLILGLATRPAALVLAGDMVGAIIVSGIALGEVISLTLAPAELLVCLYLLWTGPGAYALDHRIARRVPD